MPSFIEIILSMSMIDDFIKRSKDNPNTILVFRSHGKWKEVSYDTLLKDIYSMMGYMKRTMTRDGAILLFAYPYSYSFYLGVLAGIFSGREMVIVDSFKDKEKLEHCLNEAKVEYALCDTKTKALSFLLPKKLKLLMVNQYKKNEPNYELKDSARIITFTSGTTGNPKKIERSISFLEQQKDMVLKNISMPKEPFVYGKLPMYTLLSIFLGFPTLLCRKPKVAGEKNPTMLLLPIQELLKLKKPMKSVEASYIGGAILYERNAKRLLNLLPNANITYVYGASEGALIYKTTIEKYSKTPFTFDEKIEGISVIPMEGKGEIQIHGDTVLSTSGIHKTGDLGYIEDGKLVLIGRVKYSNPSKEYYNYRIDNRILEENPRVKEAFSFFMDNQMYCVYSGRLTKKEEPLIYYPMRRIPHDPKHRTKADYERIKRYIRKNK